MKGASGSGGGGTGLRERKKARTRAAIQAHALRLFLAQGYAATTVEQIAEAAEVSQSTLFRYFPTKEDTVLRDDYDERFVASLRRQPPELPPLQATRRALVGLFTDLSPEELATEKRRQALIVSTPELRARTLDELTEAVAQLAQVIATRVGRRADEPEVRTFAGAVIGVALSAMFAMIGDPDADIVGLLEAGLAHLEAGLPL